MKRNNLIVLLFVMMGFMVMISSCDQVEDLLPKSESDKNVEIFTKGGAWNVDTLNIKTDVLQSGESNITSDTSYYDYGTIEFQDPGAANNPGYGAGYMIHYYMENGQNKIDTLAWVPYNFISVTQEKVITIFIPDPNSEDIVVDGYDMYLDLNTREEKKVKFSGWRRETIPGGSGGSYGNFRSYSLSR